MRTVVYLALVIGCGGGKDKDKDDKATPPTETKPDLGLRPERDDRKPTGTPRPQSKLTVTRDGKPVDMQQALAWQSWDGTTKVTVSSVPVACDEVTGNMRAMHDGEVTFDLVVARVLQPDGSFKSEIKQTYFEGMTSQLTTGAVASTGDGSAGQPTTVDVDFKTESAGRDKHALVVKGTIDALGCAAPAPKNPPPALPPEMPATIDVAGKKLAIRGARLSKVGDWPQLTLTTGAEGCKSVAFAREGDLKVELTWMKKDDPAPKQVSLGGAILKQTSDQRFDPKKLTIKPAPPVAGEIEIKADIVVGGYPVKLDGKVTAVECPK
jgi:hypothetical protein